MRASSPLFAAASLVEVFRKVVTSVVCDRMKRDFMKLDVLELDPTNPGFQAGRTTASFIFPLRSAAEHCKATATEMSALLDDLKWCFDTPAHTVIELALMRLGVPAFYVSMLSDIDVHCVRSTVDSDGAWHYGWHCGDGTSPATRDRPRNCRGTDQLDTGRRHGHYGRAAAQHETSNDVDGSGTGAAG